MQIYVYGVKDSLWIVLFLFFISLNVLMISMISINSLLRRSAHFHKHCRILSGSMFTSAVCQNKIPISSRIERFQKRSLERQKQNYEDTFGDIESFGRTFEKIVDDPEDILEYQQERAAKRKTVIQYMQEIKHHLENNDYKSAINVLEIDMVNDKKPLNRLIYKILINYNARIGNLEEAYRLFINYKSRNGLVTGAFYTSLFNACANSKNSYFALEKANAIRECMNSNKFHSINISNYNSMLKAYGRHGDISSCLKIMDEVMVKRDKVKSDTYSFLLQACISDGNSGLRHALIVWRKMIQNRVKPEIFSFNLMLRCVRDCSLGDALLIPDLIKQIMKESQFFIKRKVKTETVDSVKKRTVLKSSTTDSGLLVSEKNKSPQTEEEPKKNFIDPVSKTESSEFCNLIVEEKMDDCNKFNLESSRIGSVVNMVELSKNEGAGSCNSVDSFSNLESSSGEKRESNYESEVSFSLNESEFPNFLALKPTTGAVVKLGVMTQPHHRFMLVGGAKGFLKTMVEFGVKPDLKTFTLMLSVIPPTSQAEEELMSLIESYKVLIDTGFFNVLIKRRITRNENYLIKECLKEMHALNLKPDILTFGILAMSCNTYELGMELLQALRSHCYKTNCEILSTLLKRANRARDIKYVHAVLQAAKEDDTQLSAKFLAQLSSVVRKEQYLRRMEREAVEKISDKNNLAVEG